MKITQANGKEFEDFEIIKDLIAQRQSFAVTEVAGMNGTLNLVKNEIKSSDLTCRIYTWHKGIYITIAFIITIAIAWTLGVTVTGFFVFGLGLRSFDGGLGIFLGTVSGIVIAVAIIRYFLIPWNPDYEIIKNPIAKSFEVLFIRNKKNKLHDLYLDLKNMF